MNLRDQLARVISGDSRFTIEAYLFVFESLKQARGQKLRKRRKQARLRKKSSRSESNMSPSLESAHVTGRELCLALRRLAVRNYGLMAATVLATWGLRSTSDIGDLVYRLIESGDFSKTARDKRSDFDDVFDFQTDLRPKSLVSDE